MISVLEISLLCNFEEDLDVSDLPDIIQSLWNGQWHLAITDEIYESVSKDGLRSLMERVSEIDSKDEYHKLSACGVAAFCAFCEVNWTGPSTKSAELIHGKFSKYFEKPLEASNHEEIYPTILYPGLLLLASEIFNYLAEKKNNLVTRWWKLRCYYLYQKTLDENSPRIFSILENTLGQLSNLDHTLKDYPKLRILLHIEMSQAYLLYGRVQNSDTHLKKAVELSGLKLTLKGVLGKRTKFQQDAVAQLALDVSVTPSEFRIPASVTHGSHQLIKPLKLNDDLRLENIQYLDIKENINMTLSSLEQQICLATIQYIQRSQPKDALADEELFPYINILLAQEDGPWATRINVLLMKCKLESTNKRTIERSMMQCEEIVNSFEIPLTKVTSRLSYLWASGLSPYISWRSLLADLLFSIGLVKAALDVFLQLQLWEEVIACYTVLELRHKAAEIIQQQIDIKPTVKLYCLLGDATDDITQYEKAWDFSNHRSSRAQRHWGNYLFAHKKYEECIPHYQKSCEINSLQESVWLKLGYAALSVENWELAATAYRRYTFLEPNSFEAWNNLAKVYVKQGNKERAHKALSETLKYNYDNWQVWENMLIVSLDTGHFDDVVRSYHRLLDLRTKHLDVEVLTLLVKAITQDKEDSDGNPIKRIIPRVLELFGRVTSAHPTASEVWQLYADISPTPLLKGQRLLKAYAAMTQSANWVAECKMCDIVLSLVNSLATSSLESIKHKESDSNQIWQLVSSARLTTQAVIRAVNNQKYEHFEERIATLQDMLQKMTTELQNQ